MENIYPINQVKNWELRPSLRVTRVSDREYFVEDERGFRKRLAGSNIKVIMDFLLGKNNISDSDFKSEPVQKSLDAIYKSGIIKEVPQGFNQRVRTFWDSVAPGHDPIPLTLLVLNDGIIKTDEFCDDLLLSSGKEDIYIEAQSDAESISTSTPNSVAVVLYQDFNEKLLTQHKVLATKNIPILYVRRLQTSWWIGPSFKDADNDPCIGCLSFYQTYRSITKTYIAQRGVVEGNERYWDGQIKPLRMMAAGMVISNCTKLIINNSTSDRSKVFINLLETTQERIEQHELKKRVQCPICGDPEIQVQLNNSKIDFEEKLESRAADGGHRSQDPDEFYATHKHLVSKISGPVSYLVDMSHPEDELFTFSAGQNFAMSMPRFLDLKSGLRSMSSGKGRTRAQARASALGEALERYSGLHHGDEARIVASYDELSPDERIHPNEIHLYSKKQFLEQDWWNKKPSNFHWVGEDLESSRVIEWSPVWSLNTGKRKLIPTALSYYNYRSTKYPFHPGANSNGCAAGTSYLDATVQGLYELIERDATALWWYSRCQRPQVNLESFEDSYFLRWRDMYRSKNRDAWVLDLTSDIGIPVFASISARVDKPAEDILIGLGCNADPAIALSRAMTEMNQFFPAVANVDTNGNGYSYDDPTQMDWWKNATVEAHPYLRPMGETFFTPNREMNKVSLTEELNNAVDALNKINIDVLVMNQTRADVNVPVVRVIAPGLRHFWPRFAPGRLYDVPLKLGWTDHKLSEEELNDVPLFI